VTKYEGEFKEANIKGTAKLILAKGRGVGVGSRLVGFNGLNTRFFELDSDEAKGLQEAAPLEHEEDNDLPF
jgi:hypothetical protein